MTIRVEVERIVLHDIPVSQAERPGLLAAIEHAIADQLTGGWPSRPTQSDAVPVLRPSPVPVTGGLATGIAGATVSAIARLSGGRS